MKAFLSAGLRGAPTFLLPAGLLLALALAITQAAGSFNYSLDDPYIHLALARSIQQGAYGINPGEWASPSSSILWPFLLALVPGAWMEWAPLAVNALSCSLSVLILREVLRGTALPDWAQVIGAVAVAFGLNLFGLAMTGMEHSLQVLLALYVAWCLQAGRFGVWFYLALGVMPLVRYECLALSLGAAAYVFWTKDRVRPAVCLFITLGFMVAFSGWLHSRGMPWLPASVLAKSADRSVWLNVRLQPMLFVMLAWLGWVHFRDGQRLRWALLMLAPAVACLLFGRVGWFGRYEVFLNAWLIVLVLGSAARFTTGWQRMAVPASMCVVLAVCFTSLWRCTFETPQTARFIAEQQGVTATLARELAEPVAISDLGLVAWRSGVRVLDLGGLASPEVLEAKRSGAWDGHWIEERMKQRGIEHAFVLKLFLPSLPGHWTEVGQIVTPGPDGVSIGRVALMSRSREAASRLEAVLRRLKANDARLDRLILLQDEAGFVQ